MMHVQYGTNAMQRYIIRIVKSQRKRPSIQSDTHTNAKLKEVGLSSNQEGSRGVGLTLGANLQKHHPRTQLSTMTKISIEGPKWIPIKRFKMDIKSNTSP